MHFFPLAYNSSILNYKSETNCFRQTVRKGITKLSRKPKSTGDDYACLNLAAPILHDRSYRITVSFKLKTACKHFNFYLLNEDKSRKQLILEEPIDENKINKWIFRTFEFVPEEDNFIWFGIKGEFLYGFGNYLMIDSLQISDAAAPWEVMWSNKRILENRDMLLDSQHTMQRKINAEFNGVNKILNVEFKKLDFLHWNDARLEGETTLDAKKRFFASLQTEDKNLATLQRATIILLRELAKVCDENDIPYWIDYGTLIGAVRHKGFIPWDDDIDVGMMRKDVDRLEKVMKDKHEFFTFSKHYIANIDNCNVARFKYSDNKIKVFIDIFIYDYINTDNRAATWEKAKVNRNKFNEMTRVYKEFREVEGGSWWDKREIYNPESIKAIDDIRIKLSEELGYSYDSGNSIMWGLDNVNTFMNNDGGVMAYESIFPLQKVEFAGGVYNAPNDIDLKLLKRYGDVYSIPNDMFTHLSHVSKDDAMAKLCQEAIDKYE